MPFGNQRSDFLTSVDVLHDLIESGGDNGIMMNLIRAANCTKCQRRLHSTSLQILGPRSEFELDLPHWTRTVGIETIDSSLGGAQSVSGDP